MKSLNDEGLQWYKGRIEHVNGGWQRDEPQRGSRGTVPRYIDGKRIMIWARSNEFEEMTYGLRLWSSPFKYAPWTYASQSLGIATITLFHLANSKLILGYFFPTPINATLFMLYQARDPRPPLLETCLYRNIRLDFVSTPYLPRFRCSSTCQPKAIWICRPVHADCVISSPASIAN